MSKGGLSTSKLLSFNIMLISLLTTQSINMPLHTWVLTKSIVTLHKVLLL